MADYSLDYSLSHDESGLSCTIRFRCFDVPNAVTLYWDDIEFGQAEGLLLAARRTCLAFHRLWSFSLPGSDVARLNEVADHVSIDARTADLLSRMKAFGLVEPAFDFTIGSASHLWKHAEKLPSEDDIARAMQHVGVRKIRIEDDVAVKIDPLVQVDVGGAAKGYIADELASFLRLHGVKSASIDLGGNLYMLGKHPVGRLWRVAVRIPEDIKADPIVVEVGDCAVVTSGSYERFVEIDGKRYAHIVDARTGWPSESDIVSATVFSKSAFCADLLATTACLLGSSGFTAFAARHPECGFIAITADGAILRS